MHKCFGLKDRMMRGFSMIELVFVVVILGIIASIALPKISLTRSDALYTAILADIQSIQSSMAQKFIIEDVNTATLNGQLILDTAGLSQARWVTSGNGVRLGKNGVIDSANNCALIDFSGNDLIIKIDASVGSALCKKLLKTYPNPITISLESSAIKF